MGEQPSENVLQIFHVSADTHIQFVRDEPRLGIYRGFFTEHDTGIPGLQDALLATTFDARAKNAQAFNVEVENTLKRLTLWSSDTADDCKVSTADRTVLEIRIQKKVDNVASGK